MTLKSFLFGASLVSFTLCACQQPTGDTQATTTVTVDSTAATTVPDMHTAQNALDWAGTYKGVLPCASCPGINTTIVLNDDGTFEKTTQYQGEKDKPEVIKGKFEWKNDGSNVALEESLYAVQENRLVQLDADGKAPTGELAENYVLAKVEGGK